METETHPVQTRQSKNGNARLPVSVTTKAYEVYCHVFSPQKAMIEGGCRGGFSSGEIIAFLYASSFPKKEWKVRVDQAFKGMEFL